MKFGVNGMKYSLMLFYVPSEVFNDELKIRSYSVCFAKRTVTVDTDLSQFL